MPDGVHVGSGKVRELYALDDRRLLLMASDRISTFDVVLPTEIPDKGRVLTGLSAFWFARTRALCPNHLLAVNDRAKANGVHGPILQYAILSLPFPVNATLCDNRPFSELTLSRQRL